MTSLPGLIFFFKDIKLRSGNHEVDEQNMIEGNVSVLPHIYRREVMGQRFFVPGQVRR